MISRTLSLYDTAWNIGYVVASASSEGGSELGGTGWVAQLLGACPLAGRIGPSAHRNGWNHHDTNGRTIGMIGGSAWLVPFAQSWVLPGHDDGVVAHQSSGGCVSAGAFSTLCAAISIITSSRSRPLTAAHVDLLVPNQRHEQRQSTVADDGVELVFTGDRYLLTGDEVLGVTLAVWRDDRPIAVRITRAFAAVLDSKITGVLPPELDLRGTGPYAGTFAPAAMKLDRTSQIGLFVEFEYDSTRERARFDIQYTPSAAIPARFTGIFRDAVEDGALVVHAGVHVIRAGRYVSDYNLYDAEKQPVAWTRIKVELVAGEHALPLTFLGRVLTDQNFPGPFQLGQLRGVRFAPGSEPDTEPMAPFTGTFITRAYSPDALSDAEWDSSEKQSMIRFLTEQRARGVHQGAATPSLH